MHEGNVLFYVSYVISFYTKYFYITYLFFFSPLKLIYSLVFLDSNAVVELFGIKNLFTF